MDGIDVVHRHKDLDAVLRIFLLDEEVFDDYSKIKHVSMIVGRGETIEKEF